MHDPFTHINIKWNPQNPGHDPYGSDLPFSLLKASGWTTLKAVKRLKRAVVPLPTPFIYVYEAQRMHAGRCPVGSLQLAIRRHGITVPTGSGHANSRGRKGDPGHPFPLAATLPRWQHGQLFVNENKSRCCWCRWRRWQWLLWRLEKNTQRSGKENPNLGICRCSSGLLTLEQLKARLPDGIPPELASVGSLSVFSINLLSNQCIKPAQQSAQLHRKMHLRAPRLSARYLVRHISTAISYNCKNTFFITN